LCSRWKFEHGPPLTIGLVKPQYSKESAGEHS
jgi:hypothetical protein